MLVGSSMICDAAVKSIGDELKQADRGCTAFNREITECAATIASFKVGFHGSLDSAQTPGCGKLGKHIGVDCNDEEAPDPVQLAAESVSLSASSDLIDLSQTGRQAKRTATGSIGVNEPRKRIKLETSADIPHRDQAAGSTQLSKKPCGFSSPLTGLDPTLPPTPLRKTSQHLDVWVHQTQPCSSLISYVQSRPSSKTISLIAPVTTLDKYCALKLQASHPCAEISAFDQTLLSDGSTSQFYSLSRPRHAPSTGQQLESIVEERLDPLEYLCENDPACNSIHVEKHYEPDSDLCSLCATNQVTIPDPYLVKAVPGRRLEAGVTAENVAARSIFDDVTDNLQGRSIVDDDLMSLDAFPEQPDSSTWPTSEAVDEHQHLHSIMPQPSDSLVDQLVFSAERTAITNRDVDMPVTGTNQATTKQLTNTRHSSGVSNHCPPGTQILIRGRETARSYTEALEPIREVFSPPARQSTSVDVALPPIVRPPFPSPILDRSPLLHVSNTLVLKTCFRIGEALNVGAYFARRSSTQSSNGSLIELYARVIKSFRPQRRHHERQEFVFGDLWSDKAPELRGEWTDWKGSKIFERDANLLLTPSRQNCLEEVKMCRAVGRLKREGQEWIFNVLSVWQCEWDDVFAAKVVVCGK